MSNPSAPRKRGRPPVKTTKVRQNISIDPVTLKKARRMAFESGLALSTWIDQLIRERLGQDTQ